MKPVEIEQFSDTVLRILWNDGHESLYLYNDLRDACPCAICNEFRKEEEEKKAEDSDKTKRAFKKKILNVLRERIYPEEIQTVGSYAISFEWSDAHKTGIYTFEFLRGLCPCEECQKPVSP